MAVDMWKKLRYFALISTVLTPIACIRTCCADDTDLLCAGIGCYEDGKGVVREENSGIEGEPATPAEKQNTP